MISYEVVLYMYVARIIMTITCMCPMDICTRSPILPQLMSSSPMIGELLSGVYSPLLMISCIENNNDYCDDLYCIGESLFHQYFCKLHKSIVGLDEKFVQQKVYMHTVYGDTYKKERLF
jgi:hypothetical protein